MNVKSLLQGTNSNNLPTAAEVARREEQHASRTSKVKRQKLRWRERIAPITNDAVKANEEVIDESVLTRCTRCPIHRNRQGRFRPLIGNGGEYLCDACYQKSFPATAMLDEEIANRNKVQRMGQRAYDVLRNGVADFAADIRGQGDLQPEDDNFASTTTSKPLERERFPSEVECSMCLERGVYRRCCNKYYCHSCYYKSGQCPGCSVATPLTGISAAELRPDPGKLAVGIGWAITWVLVSMTALIIISAVFNNSTMPTTLWGHTCHGWLQKCDLTVCIDYDGNHDLIEYGEARDIPAAEPYKVCDRTTTASQVVGSACVYDQEMYAWSNSLIGYDLCVSSPREENSRTSNIHPLLLHSGNHSGVYVFDDDFEMPLRNVSSSGWTEIINGVQSNACGVSKNGPIRGSHGGFGSVVNKNSLVFTGFQKRHAITTLVNVRHGGRVEFYLKMGSMTGDSASCKIAESQVVLEYRTAALNKWITFGSFPAWKYRGLDFTFIAQDIPAEAMSNMTQFRFIQPSFDALRDHWAIDDIRIFANYKSKYQDTAAFNSEYEREKAYVHFMQCCFNSQHCSVFDKKRMNFDERECDSIPGFDSDELGGNARLKLSELLMLYLCLAALAKRLYRFIVQRIRVEEHHALTTSIQSRSTDKDFPRHSFHATGQLSWQYSIAIIFLVALICILYSLLHGLMAFQCTFQQNDAAAMPYCRIEWSFAINCCVAIVFDLRAMSMLLTEVFCLEHPWRRTPLAVVVDLNPDQGYLQVGSKTIPLLNVVDTQQQSALFYWLLAILSALAGLPIALVSLTLQQSTILGSLAILREVFGPSLFVRLYLCVQWILSFNHHHRDEIGRAVLRKGLLQQAMLGAALTPLVIFSHCISRRVSQASASDTFSLFVLCVTIGGVGGLLLGLLNGLPVVPEAKLKVNSFASFCRFIATITS